MKKILSIILALCLLCSFASCKPKVGTEKNVTLYFANGTLDGVSGETATVPVELSDQELVVEVLEKLLEGPKALGNQAVIPEGTTLLSAKVGKTRVTVDFSNHFMNTQSIVDELLCRYSIVRTLSELGIGIQSVNILVNGNPLVSKVTGEPVGELSNDNMVASLAGTENVSSENVVLYFANDEMYLSKENRTVETKSTDTLEKQIVTELCEGPESKGLLAALPAETKVITVEVKDAVCYVNLSKEFTEKMNSMLEEQLKIYALVNSLTELEHIDKVQILIEGAKVESLNYIMIQDPLERNENLVTE